jgi:hypothetical protein
MPLWSEIDKELIEIGTGQRVKFSYQNGGPLRFQIPRGLTRYGIGSYKSLTVDTLNNNEFTEWYKQLEKTLCPLEPFKSNMSDYGLRIKIDDRTLLFDNMGAYIPTDMCEGTLRGDEVSCIVDLDGYYFYNGNYGITCRAYQIKTHGGAAEPAQPQVEFSECAFLATDA